MKKVWSGALTVLLGCLIGSASAAPLNLIPWPRHVVESAASYALPARPTIAFDDAAAPAAGSLREWLPARRVIADGAITLRVDPAAGTGSEGYRLVVDPDGIRIDAATASGAFYGVQTLKQLLPAHCATGCALPAVSIEDAPRFAWRGLLVDIARHYFGKPELLRVIDEMALHKLNVLHLHLTDDAGWRFEVPAYPKLTRIGARGDEEHRGAGPPRYLSRREVRELVSYAQARYIQIVPEIEFPGHAGAAARAYPQLFDGAGGLRLGSSAAWAFVREVYAEAARQFPSRYLHFGGDEFGGARWEQQPEVQQLRHDRGLDGARAVEGYFDNEVAAVITALGRTPMGWDETAEAGVRPDVLIQWWRKSRPDVLDAAVRGGHDVVLSPVDQVYFDYPNALGEPGAPWEGNDNGPTSIAKILAWEPVPARYPPEDAAHIRGVEAAVWTEFIRSERYLQYMLYPRLYAFAEVAWRPAGPRDPTEFNARLQPDLDRHAARGGHARRSATDAAEYRVH